MIAVESGGNPRAIGDHGEAYGVLQIHQCVIDDVNRISGLGYTMQDAFDAEKSKRICMIYLNHWGYDRGHRSQEELVRIWNKGPEGYRDPASIPHWLKVKRELTKARR